MGKKIIIPGADFSQNGIRTGNVVDVTLKSSGSSSYSFYFLPTAATYVSDITVDPTVPNDAVIKTKSADGQEPIENTYAGFLFGKVAEGATPNIQELVINLNSPASYKMAFNGLKCDTLDLRGVNFGEGASIARLCSNASIQELKMPNIYASSIERAFAKFNNDIVTDYIDFSFIKKVTSNLTGAFQFLKAQTANFNDIDVSEATIFNNTFNSCEMTEINLSKWHIDSAEWCTSMFQWCNNLQTIHLDNWNSTISNSARYANMFANTPALTTVFVTNCSSTVKTWLLARLNECTAGGSSNWIESTVGGKAALVKGS